MKTLDLKTQTLALTKMGFVYICVYAVVLRGFCNCATDLWVYFPKCRGFWTRCAYMGCFELGISKPNLAHTKLVKEKIFIYLFTKYWTLLSAITFFFFYKYDSFSTCRVCSIIIIFYYQTKTLIYFMV